MAEEDFLREGQRRYDVMLHRRGMIRQFIDENYGVHREKRELVEWLHEQGLPCSYSTLQRDFLTMGVREVSAVIEGRRVKFWTIPSVVSEFSPERLTDRLDQQVIEAEAYRALMRSVLDVFVDGKRVVLLVVYEHAKPITLWLKNLAWPEIWYFSKEDGSTVIIECRSEGHARFLRQRMWGDVDTDDVD